MHDAEIVRVGNCSSKDIWVLLRLFPQLFAQLVTKSSSPLIEFQNSLLIRAVALVLMS